MHPFNRRHSYAALTALIFSLVLPGGVRAAPAEAGGKHSLWRVTSKTNTVYLLGSVHVLPKTAYPLAACIEQAYGDARRLMVEVDLASMDPAKLQQLVLAKGLITNNLTLRDTLSSNAYALVQQRVIKCGLSMEPFEHMKPWVLVVALAGAELMRLGYDPKQGIDQYFMGKAAQDGKKIVGLETAEFQLDLFADLSMDLQETLLLQTLKDFDQLEAQVAMLVKGWQTGDLAAMEKILLESFQEFPALYKIILSNRNRNWLPQIEALIGQKDNALVVVGAAHLAGKDGIIALLRKKGYTVQQL